MMDKSIDFWNKISSKYDLQVISKYSLAYDATIRKTKVYLKSTDRVLDYGCGTGITAIELANSVNEIIAFDTSENMIDIAKKKSVIEEKKNIHFGVNDIFDNSLKAGTFDVVLGFNILYFIKDLDKTLNRIRELLKPDGFFISVTDCLGEKNTFANNIKYFLSRMKILPYMRQFKMKDLEKTIRKSGFIIVESENLYENPPNFYLVAQKK